MSPRTHGWSLFGGLTVAVGALDQASKLVVAQLLERGERVDLIPGVELVSVRNRGIAFGLLADGGAAIPVLTGVAVLAMLAWFARHAAAPGAWLPIGLLVGGALGNLADRVRAGSVTDFIDLPLWPAFNLADIAIVAGLAVLLVAPLLGREHGRA